MKLAAYRGDVAGAESGAKQRHTKIAAAGKQPGAALAQLLVIDKEQAVIQRLVDSVEHVA